MNTCQKNNNSVILSLSKDRNRKWITWFDRVYPEFIEGFTMTNMLKLDLWPKFRVHAILLCCLALTNCSTLEDVTTNMDTHSDARIVWLQGPNGETVKVVAEIADERHEHAEGLMHREELPEGTGMLFIFEEEQPLDFWMKNTLIPLDILYFDAEGILVSTATMEPCSGDPCRSYPSTEPARFALEVNAGFVAKQGINKNWTIATEE